MGGIPSAVINHPHRDLIEADIRGGITERKIAETYGLNQPTVHRAKVALAQGQGPASKTPNAKKTIDNPRPKALPSVPPPQEPVVEISSEMTIDWVVTRLKRLLEACDTYLMDPRDPTKYDLYPRAWEYDVVYRQVEPDTGLMTTKKESLQSILDKIDQQGYQPWEVRVRSEDPRRTLVSTASAIIKGLETLGKLQGKIKEGVEVKISLHQSWTEVKAIVLNATDGYPEVQERILQEIDARG